MRRRFIPFEILIAIVLFGSLLAADTSAGPFNDTIRRDFFIGDDRKRIYYTLRGFQDAPDGKREAAKVQFADWAQTYWTQFEEHEFRSPAFEIEDGVETLRLVHERGACCTGNFYGGHTPLVTRGPLNTINERINRNLEVTIAHEIFHAVQHHYNNFANYSANIEEGMAVYIPELLDVRLRNLILDDPDNCHSKYIKGSRGSLLFRPGGGPDESNVCAASLWWKFMAQQFAEDGRDQFAVELDTMRRLLESLEYFGGWRSRAIDDLQFVDDFNGDDVDDIFVRSDRYMGLVSRPFWEPRTWDVKLDGGRIGSGWRFHETDRTPAHCDFTGDSRRELLIVSDSHVGVLEIDRDGQFRSGPITHYSALGAGGTPVDLRRAEFLAGDFDGDEKCEVLMKHPAGLTLLEVDGDRSRLYPTTSIAPGERLGGQWRLRPVDRLIAAGDFDGDGRDEFLLSNEQYVGAGGLDGRTGREFITEAAYVAGYRIPGSTVPIGIAADDRIFTGRFFGTDKVSIAKAGLRGVLVFSLRDAGSGFVFESEREEGIFRGGRTSMLAADLEGNGVDVLIERTHAGAVRALRPRVDGTIAQNTLLRPGQVLNDGENGSGSPERPDFTIYANMKLEASGDFNGDGTEDLAVRSGVTRQVLYAHESAEGIEFTIDKPINDGDRYNGLASGLDRFIRKNSGTGHDARTLKSTFSDFSLANVFMFFDGGESRLQYANPDDAENFQYHAGLIFEGERVAEELVHDPWAISYTGIRSSIPGPMRIEVKGSNPQETPEFHLLVIDGRQSVSQYSVRGSDFSRTVNLSDGDMALLVAVSMEAPLTFEVSASP